MPMDASVNRDAELDAGLPVNGDAAAAPQMQ